MGELAWAMVLLPTQLTQGGFLDYTKPVQLIAWLEPQPLQSLALMANSDGTVFKTVVQAHIRTQFGQHPHSPALTDMPLGAQINVGHVSQHKIRQPVQVSLAPMQAGFKNKASPRCPGANQDTNGIRRIPRS